MEGRRGRVPFPTYRQKEALGCVRVVESELFLLN